MEGHTSHLTSAEFDEKEQDLTSANTTIHISLSRVESSQDTPQRTSITVVQHFTGEEAFPRDIHGWKWGLVTTAILSSIYLYSVDVTIVADVQPIIILEFGFLVTATATNLIWGKYRSVQCEMDISLCVLIFEVGSAVCGAAPSMDAMIIGRAICGIGVMTLIAMTTTMPERPLYVSGTGLTWGIGIVTGPIIGGAFSDSSAGWRWAFYINLVIGAVAAPIWLFLLPNKTHVKELLSNIAQKRWTTLVPLSALVLSSPVSWLSLFGGITYPWNSGRIIGLFVASGDYSFTNKVRRIIPVEFFSSRTVLILFAVTSAGGTAVFVPIYMIPLFFPVHAWRPFQSRRL
ncbi:major facilitator superfamily domain-containing protein [Bisporella sp. PMI_857]|nr:major facilitator superfamily domain-containing protein [Bisporella sp. PMI_857]